MTFEEWYNEDEHDLYNYPEESMKAAWNAAVDEAVKIAYEAYLDTSKDCRDAGDRIKELKQ